MIDAASERRHGQRVAGVFSTAAASERRYQSIESYLQEHPELTAADLNAKSIELMEQGLCLYRERVGLDPEQAATLRAKHAVLSSFWIYAQEWAWNLRPSDVMRADVVGTLEDIESFCVSDDDRDVLRNDEYPALRDDLKRRHDELDELVRRSRDLAETITQTLDRFEQGVWSDSSDVRQAAIAIPSQRLDEYRRMNEDHDRVHPWSERVGPHPAGMLGLTGIDLEF